MNLPSWKIHLCTIMYTAGTKTYKEQKNTIISDDSRMEYTVKVKNSNLEKTKETHSKREGPREIEEHLKLILKVKLTLFTG